MTKKIYNIVFKVLVCTIVMISCSPKSSYHFKSFFFDGVPDPINENSIIANINSIDSTGFKKRDSILEQAKSKEIYHPPFQEKKCKTCHQKYKRSESMANNKALCYTCHDQFEYTYQTLHGPVDFGHCTQCHNPHKSKYEGLLTQNDNQLCLECHDQSYLLQTSIHNRLDETQQCLNCHNPHGANTRFLLTQNSCFGCHDNYNSKFNNVHGPVAAGLCVNCHEDHNSKQPHLLTNTTNALCLNCHNAQDLNKTSTHKETNTKSCTTCHNPHGGSNHYLLNKTALQ
ncbi:cytochrome c3 family protein [Aestuariivivens marinum]|uniref:cytochrome c3 family protein n=1 Tax=Aestuariivivens marinum TaxID=2913555 RepID=UPI001F57FF16|nr:cytochrome c3 family protein [Aestuariivivens marinum]